MIAASCGRGATLATLGVDDPSAMRIVPAVSPALVEPVEVHGGAGTTCAPVVTYARSASTRS